MDNRFSTMTEVRRVAWPATRGRSGAAPNFLQGIAGTLELFHRSTLSFQQAAGEVTGHPVAVFQRIDQAGYQAADRRADPRRHRHADGVRARPPAVRARGLARRRSRRSARGSSARAPACSWRRTTMSASPTTSSSGRWSTRTTAMRSCRASSASAEYTRSLMKALDVPVRQRYGLRPGDGRRHDATSRR